MGGGWMKGKILIADDEERMRKLLSDFLHKEGYTILEAQNGREALELFMAQTDINLFILDWIIAPLHIMQGSSVT